MTEFATFLDRLSTYCRVLLLEMMARRAVRRAGDRSVGPESGFS
jgi:hypothetical protein